MEQRYLAQYSIRSKQAYIFRTNAIVEISGGSALIHDAWDLLFQAAADVGVGSRRATETDRFSWDTAFSDGTGMVELFCGGGNDTVLFCDEETFRLVNAAFTRRLLEDCPGMVPLCVGISASGNYSEDYRSLMAAVDCAKRQMPQVSGNAMLPFSEMDRKTFLPVVRKDRARAQSYSAESDAKRVRASRLSGNVGETLLDRIVNREDGRSLLAIVHADGNNMGVKIRGYLREEACYDVAVEKMRRFTSETMKAFIDAPKRAISANEALKDKAIRWVVNDGDDVTLLCDAHDALDFAKCYLDAVSQYQCDDFCDGSGEPIRFSSCAGVCIFHAHYPFSMAYQLAEDACDSAKKPVHASGNDEAWLDFHYIHSGLAEGLNAIRDRQGMCGCIARPWRMDGENSFAARMQNMAEILHGAGVSRSRIKRIGAAVENGFAEAQTELALLYDRHPGVNDSLEKLFGTEENLLLRAFYDLYEVYDLWFIKDKTGEKGGEN